MRNPILQIGIILFVALTVFFTNLGTPRLWDRDEPRNAGCAAEMLDRGDWVVPVFNSQLRKHKPALLYWLMMSAYSVWGVTEFAARFWSAALAVGTCLATYVIGKRLYDDRIGLLAGIALATSMMFVVAARAATPDSVLVFCGTVSLMFFVVGAFPRLEESSEKQAGGDPAVWFPTNSWIVVAMYLTMGLGVLAKGPIGFLLPMAMIGMYGLLKTLPERETANRVEDNFWQRAKAGLWHLVRCFEPVHFGRVLWAMRPITATALILAVSLPWFVLVHIRTEGDFTQLFFIGEHFGRATEAMENHSGGVWFYPLAILIGFFPWSCFWGPVLADLLTPVQTNDRLAERQRDANCFLLCWIIIQVGAFTIARTKLPSYVTPCYPALALLTASCFVRFADRAGKTLNLQPLDLQKRFSDRAWLFAAFAGLGIGGVLVAAGLFFGADYLVPEVAADGQTSQIAAAGIVPTLKSLAALGLIPVIASVLLVVSLAKRWNQCLTTIYAVAAFGFALAVFSFGAVEVDRHRECMTILSEAKTRPGALATYGCHESTWVFYSQKPITELIVERSAPWTPIGKTASALPERKFWKPMPWLTLSQFVGSNENALIITTDEFAESLLARLPADYSLICESDYFLKNKRLCLIGRDQPKK
jgi:4-amino-4-deoxy-L-arabinose transferase-like glycosyltransferase